MFCWQELSPEGPEDAGRPDRYHLGVYQGPELFTHEACNLDGAVIEVLPWAPDEVGNMVRPNQMCRRCFGSAPTRPRCYRPTPIT